VQDPHSPCAGARDNSYVRHPLSCQSYYHCMHGRADLEDKCPTGFAFNFEDQICDFTDMVNCASCPLTGTVDVADPEACNYFYRCVNGVRTQHSCTSGERFDSEVGACRPRAQVRCSTASICSQRNTISSIVVADYNDCKKFFVCLDRTSTPSFCTDDDHYFDPKTSACDVKEKVDLCVDGIPLMVTEVTMNGHTHPNARPIRPPGPDDQNPNARPIRPTTRPPDGPNNDEWNVPNGPSTTRRPPSWGPPRAPGGGAFAFPPIIFPPTTTTRRPRPPGGLGVHRPEAAPRPPPPPPPGEREPVWGPPRNPGGGGFGGGGFGGGSPAAGGGGAGRGGGSNFPSFPGNSVGIPQDAQK